MPMKLMPGEMAGLLVRNRLMYGLTSGRAYGLFGLGFGGTYGPCAQAGAAARPIHSARGRIRKVIALPPARHSCGARQHASRYLTRTASTNQANLIGCCYCYCSG